MAIDLDALQSASKGDGNGKVAVRQAWLREVHSELMELQRLRKKLDDRANMSGVLDGLFGMGGRR